jgi:hypothetical protein
MQFAAPVEKKKVNLCRILAILALVVILGLTTGFALNDLSYVPISATVQYDAQYVYVTNDDNFVWEDVRMVIDADYNYRTDSIQPHDRLIIDYGKFIKDNKVKYNPVIGTTNILITIKTADNHWGTWYCHYTD